MCLELIHNLELGRTRWRDITEPEKKAAADHVLRDLGRRYKGEKFSRGRWSRIAPSWCPIHAHYIVRLFEADGVQSWPDLMSRYGLSAGHRPGRPGTGHSRSGRIARCDCGEEATHHVPIWICNPNLEQRKTYLDLCDSCYAEFIEIENDKP